MLNSTPLSTLNIDNDTGKIAFTWLDGSQSHVAISNLRGMCPCASCQGHGNAPKFIDNTARSITKADYVGRYALAFTFGDGHSTGIYTWDFLRQICNLDN